jgi:hypothetical protein
LASIFITVAVRVSLLLTEPEGLSWAAAGRAAPVNSADAVTMIADRAALEFVFMFNSLPCVVVL